MGQIRGRRADIDQPGGPDQVQEGGSDQPVGPERGQESGSEEQSGPDLGPGNRTRAMVS